jgi:ABC-type multidrug transport system ATPase subunit
MHVQVGNEEMKGISGGEKRRLSIGIQLLGDPSICLFDEPTTGLDAFTARHIVQTLKSLAIVNNSNNNRSSQGGSHYQPPSFPTDESSPNPLLVVNSLPSPASTAQPTTTATTMKRRRTVVLSIHQPRYDIFACIDDVTLLSRGDIVWSGTVKDMLSHFDQLGFPCPGLVNPADFILDLSSLDVSHVFISLFINF